VTDSKDVRLGLWRDNTHARALYALRRKDESAAILDRSLAESQRLGLLGMAFEARLASMEAGKTPPSQLASDAQQSGFLLIARRARR
jgi:hypothetical protein